METLKDEQQMEVLYHLKGFWGNWRLPSSARSVVLEVSGVRNEYCFQFLSDDGSDPVSVRGHLSELQLGVEHFVWLAEAFLFTEETSQYRQGRFANCLAVVNEIGPVVVIIRVLAPHPAYPRVRCDFFLTMPNSGTGIRQYYRFEIIVDLNKAKEFGESLLKGLNWTEYPV